MDLFGQWGQLPEAGETHARPLFLQAIKALEFDQADEIIRKPMPKLEDVADILPEDEQQRLKQLLEGESKEPEGGEETESAPGGGMPDLAAMLGGGGGPPEAGAMPEGAPDMNDLLGGGVPPMPPSGPAMPAGPMPQAPAAPAQGGGVNPTEAL